MRRQESQHCTWSLLTPAVSCMLQSHDRAWSWSQAGWPAQSPCHQAAASVWQSLRHAGPVAHGTHLSHVKAASPGPWFSAHSLHTKKYNKPKKKKNQFSDTGGGVPSSWTPTSVDPNCNAWITETVDLMLILVHARPLKITGWQENC